MRQNCADALALIALKTARYPAENCPTSGTRVFAINIGHSSLERESETLDGHNTKGQGAILSSIPHEVS